MLWLIVVGVPVVVALVSYYIKGTVSSLEEVISKFDATTLYVMIAAFIVIVLIIYIPKMNGYQIIAIFIFILITTLVGVTFLYIELKLSESR